LALAIAKEKRQMPLPGTMGAPVFRGADVTKFIEAYESLSSRTGTDPAAEDVIATFPYYCSETIQETIKMMSGYLKKDWELLKEELKDAFRHADSRVYMYTRSYLERLCKDQRERGNVGLKAFILAYDNISRIMIDKGALAEYSQVEMLLGALPRNLRAKAVMKLELDPRDPSTFKYDKLRKHVLDKCVTADALALLDSEGARTAPGVSPYSVPAGVPHPQMPVVINFRQSLAKIGRERLQGKWKAYTTGKRRDRLRKKGNSQSKKGDYRGQ
jgi:hypothetical protein